VSFDAARCPIVVNCRDRVTHLRSLVAWLERAGHRNIILLDNGSTYGPLLAYLRRSPHKVVWLGQNLGSHAIWDCGLRLTDDWYVYTDPDVIPTEDCPLDAVAYLHGLLDRHSDFPKAGLGLHIGDVPNSLASLDWERSLVCPGRLVPGEHDVYSSLVDTTFALYRPRTVHGLVALRTGGDYQVRHMPWYYPSTHVSDEDRYYLDHAIAGPRGSSWAQIA
jgi:hypothetical protein